MLRGRGRRPQGEGLVGRLPLAGPGEVRSAPGGSGAARTLRPGRAYRPARASLSGRSGGSGLARLA
ncbi:hypothetical protein, partial [Methylobacterium segetis]|uniref:hypothetical protein n=1 Tax=Methylobacterium segetis TaxID=2488750 RepID=UPI001A9F02BC